MSSLNILLIILIINLLANVVKKDFNLIIMTN